MCIIYLAGGLLQRWGSPLKLRAVQQWFRNEVGPDRSTMDPEAAQDPRQSSPPGPEPPPAPEPMTMERSLSSESGSNSSLSTVYFEKKSGSAASSRSGSAASTSRSPPDQEIAARLLSWPSPSFGKEQGHGEDDQSSSKILVKSPEKENENKLVMKADSVSAVEDPQNETTVIQELQKSSDTIVKEFRHTESVMIKEAEEAAGSCCSCCRTLSGCCRSSGICGDIAAVLCCPFTVVSLLSCICFRCPKMFASKTAEKVKSMKSRGKGDEHNTSREESELEKSTRTASEVSPSAIVKHECHCDSQHDDTKCPHSQSEKKDPPIGTHRNYFFPSPGAEDDRPGGEKSGGR